MANAHAPLFLKPLMVERVWGGNRLQKMYGKTIPPGQTIGESWELADRPEAQSIVASGPHEGRTLRDVIAENPEAVLGPSLLHHAQQFPLLIKYVDAGTPLSVQIHPDDAGAAPFNDRGKSECWVVVHAEPGAKIVRGLKAGITREQYRDAVREDRVEEVLHSFSPRTGDVIALPAGMVHAIGAGLVVAEIQQNSDLTFRIYDYKRIGLDGKPRTLHVDEALHAIRFDRQFDTFEGDMSSDTVTPQSRDIEKDLTIESLISGRYFKLDRIKIGPGAKINLLESPAARVIMAIEGAGSVAGQKIAAGQTLLLPANCNSDFDAGKSGLTLLDATPK